MDDGEALLAAIYANRRDDTPRLIYADWLDENAASADCAACKGTGKVRHVVESTYGFRPEYECGACTTCKGVGQVPDDKAARADFIRNCPLLVHHRVRYGRWEWMFDKYDTGSAPWHCGIPQAYRARAMMVVPPRVKEHLSSYTIRRGFLDTVTLLPAAWENPKVRGTLLATYPLTGVVFTGPVRVQVHPGMTHPADYMVRLPGKTIYHKIPFGVRGTRKCPGLALCRIEWPSIEFSYDGSGAGVSLTDLDWGAT